MPGMIKGNQGQTITLRDSTELYGDELGLFPWDGMTEDAEIAVLIRFSKMDSYMT
jgi:hypothetical protein